MKILLTGGTGLIGRYLIPSLKALHHDVTVITRNPEKASRKFNKNVTLWNCLTDQNQLDGFDAVINLAGEPIFRKRWTKKQKQCLCSSRWFITEKLVELFHESENPPSVLISGSAVGYYGNLGDVVVTEDEPPKNEFIHKLCSRWEKIAYGAQNDKTRVCLIRTGVVLTPKGGYLEKMSRIFKASLGGPSGNGHQYIPWIHIDDMINGILWLLNNQLQGPFNMVSPYPVRNKEFSHALAQVLSKPEIIRIPAFVIRLIMGEASILLLGGQRAIPKRLQETGFTFYWEDLKKALRNLLN